jgi:hypothetical protein
MLYRKNITFVGALERVAKDAVKLVELEGHLARVGAPPFSNLPLLPDPRNYLNADEFGPDSQQHCIDCFRNHHTNYRFCEDCIILDYCGYCEAFCHRLRKHEHGLIYSCSGTCRSRISEEPLTKFERQKCKKVPTAGQLFKMVKRERLWIRTGVACSGRLIRADLTDEDSEING